MKFHIVILLLLFFSCTKPNDGETLTLNANYIIGDVFYMETQTKKVYDDKSIANRDSIFESIDRFRFEVGNDTIINNIICRTLVKNSLNTGSKEIEYLQIRNNGIYRIAYSIFGDINLIQILDTPSLLIPRPVRYRDSFTSILYDEIEVKYNVNEQLTIDIGSEEYKCLGFEYIYKSQDNPNLKFRFKDYYYERGIVKSIAESTKEYQDSKRNGYETINITSTRYQP